MTLGLKLAGSMWGWYWRPGPNLGSGHDLPPAAAGVASTTAATAIIPRIAAMRLGMGLPFLLGVALSARRDQTTPNLTRT